jgi:RNA polymerase sigma-70 factor (ECF subfamily)
LRRVGSGVSDFELAQAVAGGDVNALGTLYDRYGAVAHSVAVRIVRDQALAEDIVQESFLKLWNGAAGFDAGRGSLRGWLLTLVRNRAIDQLRGRNAQEKREVDVAAVESLEAPPAQADPWRAVAFALERAAVREALARLPVEQKQAVELAYYRGYSLRQIAEISKVPLSTIKGRMRLALDKLHSYLEGKGLMDDR